MSGYERITVTIDRSKWLRGEGSAKSFLLRVEDGKMCCLGFAALALGRTEDQIRGWQSPSCGEDTNRAGHGTRMLQVNVSGYTNEVDQVISAMEVNDDIHTSDDEKEEKIIDLLYDLGLDVVFVDGVPDAA